MGTEIAFSTVYVFQLSDSWLLWIIGGLAVVCLIVVASNFALTAAKNRRKAANREKIGKYALIKMLGQGGSADVYLAKHEESHKHSAVKLLRPQAGDAAVLRFQREVRVLREVSNPHIIQLMDSGKAADGSHYYAMEYLEGLSLLEVVSRFGPMSDGRAKYVLIQVCAALQELHAADMVHRDVNPANIIVCSSSGHGDFASLVDFGLVLDLKDNLQSTDGSVAGTPAFISPEAAAGDARLDSRSDIYSLGCVAYFLVSGVPPFRGSTPIEICWKHLNEMPIDISEAAKQPVSNQFCQLIRRSLQKAADDRQQSVTQLLQELERCETQLEWSSTEANRWWDHNRDLAK